MSRATDQILERLQALGDGDIAAHSRKFFKTGKGEYGEGDLFLGIRVPKVRKCVREFRNTSLENTLHLLRSPYHEARLLALLLLVERYGRAPSASEQRAIYLAYLKNTPFINNWDLVDSSAPQIVGAYLFTRNRSPLYKLARSKSLWERRIAMLATLYFIRRKEFDDTLSISEILLNDNEDLIHKAVGWMLREVGKRDFQKEDVFLRENYKNMPRTMLRYAIEKYPKVDRKAYLSGLVWLRNDMPHGLSG
jgi:3-methyladenine DNA glycosylase AlkD